MLRLVRKPLPDPPRTRPCAACGYDFPATTIEKTGGYCTACEWMSTGEAMSILHVKRDVLYALADRGILTRVKITARTHRWRRIDFDHLADHASRKPIMQSHLSTYLQ